MDDDQLLRRVIQRDEEAFRALYARHAPTVYGLLCRLAGDHGEAVDLLHETWLHALRHLALFRGQCTFGSWLSGIGLNCYRDWRRRHSHDVALEAGRRDGHAMGEDDGQLAGAGAPLAPPPDAEDDLVTALRQRGLLRRPFSAIVFWAAGVVLLLVILSGLAVWVIRSG